MRLSDRTPFIHSVTIPSNSSLPGTLKGECACYYIKPELHKLGLIQKKQPLGISCGVIIQSEPFVICFAAEAGWMKKL